jgi:hypothetical protein
VKGGELLTPRTGRPKTENPRTNQIGITLSDEDYQNVLEAREKDKQPEISLSTWVARKVAELAKRLVGKK